MLVHFAAVLKLVKLARRRTFLRVCNRLIGNSHCNFAAVEYDLGNPTIKPLDNKGPLPFRMNTSSLAFGKRQARASQLAVSVGHESAAKSATSFGATQRHVRGLV